MGVDVFNTLDISIHALRKESDIRAYDGQAWSIFQSTLSVRRATKTSVWRPLGVAISIHALRKESDMLFHVGSSEINISIHALRKESDPVAQRQTDTHPDFNPRSP